MENFLIACWSVLLDLAPWLLLGTVVAGVLHVLLPADFLKRHLTGSKGVVKAVLFGVPLPLCSCGVVPVGLSLKKSGSSDGATVAFLISTPQTGVDSIFVSASLLGWPFALFKVVSAAVTGIVGGWLTNLRETPTPSTDLTDEPPITAAAKNPFVTGFHHGSELLQSIWRWLVFGILISAAIEVFLPENAFEGLAAYGGIAAMLVMLLISLPLYVCATASVPIAASLVAGGLPTGAALVFLMAGPATNVATLGAVYRTLGRRPLLIYLATVIVGSIGCGLAFGFVIDATPDSAIHTHSLQTWWASVSAAILLAMFAWFFFCDLRRFYARKFSFRDKNLGPAIEIAVEGMTCSRCVAHLEKTLTNATGISAASVTLNPGRATVQGNVSENQVRGLIKKAGFRPQD